MIYKTLYDKLKGRSIDNDSESDVVLRLKKQYAVLCVVRTRNRERGHV